MANIYAAALPGQAGYTVTVKPHLGKREVVQPALQSGEVDVLPSTSAASSSICRRARLPATSLRRSPKASDLDQATGSETGTYSRGRLCANPGQRLVKR